MTGPRERSAPPWHGIDGVVRVLAPAGAGPISDFLDTTRAATGEVFADARIETLSQLSAAFLRDPELRQDPASVAVAYWMRKAQLVRLRDDYRRRVAADPTIVRVPAGRVFHVAPSNVDTLFVYSWALSYLCGNANVVRVSQESGPVVEAMLRSIGEVARTDQTLAQGNRFVTYAHDAEASSGISMWCSQRVIWGGNETIAALRPLSLNPHAGERVFGTKFSYSVFAASRYTAADAESRAKLANGFFNDLFWFDQMACSSPHVLFWIGEAPEVERAIEAFEQALQGEVDRRGFSPTASSAVHRRAFAFELAADADVLVSLARPGFVGVRVRGEEGLSRDTCGGGLIRHHRLQSLDQLADYAEESDQTLTHFGFEPADLAALAARAGARGLDRIVPVGEALAFDAVWDGFDLLNDFTRGVRVR